MRIKNILNSLLDDMKKGAIIKFDNRADFSDFLSIVQDITPTRFFFGAKWWNYNPEFGVSCNHSNNMISYEQIGSRLKTVNYRPDIYQSLHFEEVYLPVIDDLI